MGFSLQPSWKMISGPTQFLQYSLMSQKAWEWGFTGSFCLHGGVIKDGTVKMISLNRGMEQLLMPSWWTMVGKKAKHWN